MIKTLEIDLRRPLSPIYLDGRYQRLLAFIFWGYQPLGMVQFPLSPTGELAVSELKSRILSHLGWNLWEQFTTGMLSSFEKLDSEILRPFSVIVCTRNRAVSLSHTLQALQGLDYPSYEVIVVDNASSDARVKTTAQASGFRYVYERQPGLDFARNRGIREAKYGFVAFVDDDARPGRGWLRGLAWGFHLARADAVTGMVLPAELETRAQNEFEQYGGMNKGYAGYTIHRSNLKKWDLYRPHNWGVGTNMAFRRDIFDKAGFFDPGLDVGTPTGGAGDIEFFYRLVAAGLLLRYEPAAVVRHVHRRDLPALRKQIFNNGRSYPAFLLTIARNNPRKRIEVAWFALRHWLWPWLVKRLILAVWNRDSLTLRFAFTELQGSMTSGFAYWKSRRFVRKINAVS